MIQVIERFHRILEHLSAAPDRPCQLGELAELLNISAPAAANIVRAMTELGYVRALGRRRGYLPGPALYALGRGNPYLYLSSIARPEIERLAACCRELVVLGCECGGKRSELLRLAGASEITIRQPHPHGTFYNLFRCGTGILLLAYMDESRLRQLWEYWHGEDNILNLNEFNLFQARCREIAAAGMFCSGDEPPPAVSGAQRISIAFPILQSGVPIAALGVLVPRKEFNSAGDSPALAAARQCALNIGNLLEQ